VRLCAGVREMLGQRHRHAHTVRVARLAARLARAHGLEPQQALLAGLLHDLARLYSPERLLDECRARGMAFDAFERSHPMVLHARLGAELAREYFGIRDEIVLDAIRSHTLAAGRMSRTAVIVYLADSVEPGRDYAEREQFEKLALRDLDAAMRAVLASTIAHYSARGDDVAPQTSAAVAAFAGG